MTPPDDFDPPIGVAETLAPKLRRIVAPNPSPMTYRGTNTYLVGDHEIMVIDPGPDSAPHLAAILNSIGPTQKITKIVVTHAHLDHSPLARALSRETGAQVFGFGPAHAGQSAVMQELAASGLLGGGEGIDAEFAPDVVLSDGDMIGIDGETLETIHTPGHIGNHICLAWNDLCFTADHVMGWASSLVSPPDGDLTDFMASCDRLSRHPWQRFYPGHGDVIENPQARLEWLIAHRKGREAEILEALADGPATAATLARLIYAQTPAALLGAATRNVLAHLVDLTGRNQVSPENSIHEEAVFRKR